jgi:hypothetical protein
MLDATHFGQPHAHTEHNFGSAVGFAYKPAMNNPLDARETAQQLACILDPTAVYEVRAVNVSQSFDPHNKTYSALFRGNELDELAREILRLSGHCQGIYATINPLKEQRFAYLPGFHRLRPAFKTTRDTDILFWHEVVCDFDAPRAAGHTNDPATDDERAAAWERMIQAREKLLAAGYPAPTVEDSGNGFYLRFKLVPFAVDKSDDLVRRLFEAIGSDTTVHNPSRIMRLPGGLNCKGRASAERPWRVARVLEVGSAERVTREQLEAVAIPPGTVKGKAGAAVGGSTSSSVANGLDEWAGIAPSGTGFTRLTPDMEDRARAYLDTIESAIAGQRGSNPTLWAARVLIHGFRFSEADTLTLLERCYNPRCVPEWSQKELLHKINDAASKPFRKAEGWALEKRPRRSGWADITPEDAKALALLDRLSKMAGANTPVCAAPATARQETRGQPEALAEQPVQPCDQPCEPCPYAARDDMHDEIAMSCRRCGNQSPVRFEKDGIRFVADRDCGNGTLCRACLEKRLHGLLKMSGAYVIRTSVEEEPKTRRDLFAAILPTGTSPATKRAVQRRGGERVSVLTEDVAGTAEILSGGSDVSRFLLCEYKVEGEIATSGPLPDQPGYLWVISLPAGVEPPTGFHRISPAAAIRAIHRAATTVPVAPTGVTRYKPTHKSAGWGDEEETEPTNTRCLGPSVFKKREVAEILNGANVPVVTVQFDSKQRGTTGVGWCLPPLQSAALSLWVGGTAAPFRPDVERVVELATHWLPQLAKVSGQVGDGPRVQEVLREHLWYVSLYEIGGIEEQLRKADGQDKAAAELEAEGKAILASLREQYRGREGEATGFVAFVLAC